MNIGEVQIREVNGMTVWMKRLHERFYVMNGVYCVGDGQFDMESPDMIESYLDCANDEYIIYPGADNGYAVSFASLMNGKFSANFHRLSWHRDLVSAGDCEVALNEYKNWAVLHERKA